ncbi:PAQR family membrane homeostasis protein TrhA [Thiocapsa marina]|uniref:Channel protein, hemolysin III family n=1 Tax=Thiocapsa marina 5811 TaxID=768671 RepID=F9UA71_9GAMM|nr:hemolysin III family protein [Thiocapsa marina]EGV19019.1 channel protein, hemolysin III family [Thiocapsa marina 5811]
MYAGERFNSISHLVGAVLALIGVAVLVTLSGMQGGALRIASFSVYGATLFLLYLFSTLYHSLRGRAKKVFKVLDHVAIYLLIAGTYTPFSLLALKGQTGWWMFGAIWTLAGIGVAIDSIPHGKRRILPMIIYLTMGWLIVFALEPLVTSLPPAGVRGLVAGGLFYTFGIVFYALDRRFSWAHGVWHLFVLAGSISHYLTILIFL